MTGSRELRVSVITPCYNAGATIAEALRSAAAQTLPPFEILVIDDGSTDGSEAEVAVSGVEVRVLRTARLNAAGARNAGLRAARGEWVAFLDADDAWLPHHLERAALTLRGTQDVAYMAHWERFGDSGPVAQFAPLPLAAPTAGLGHQQFFGWLARWRYFCHGGVVAGRDVVLAAGLFDETLERRHDYELFLRVIHGRTWAYDPRVGWRYRADTPGALSRDDVRCQYFFLRGLLKNRARYAGHDMEAMLRIQARKALAAAFTDGTADDRRRAWEAASPVVTRLDRLVFAGAALAPAAFAALNRLRRHLLGHPPARTGR